MRFAATAALLLSPTLLFSPTRSAAANPIGDRSAVSRTQVSQSFGRLPLSFTANRGQAGSRTAFLAQGSGYSIALRSEMPEAVLRGHPDPRTTYTKRMGLTGPLRSAQVAQDIMRLNFPGASPALAASGLERLPGDSNYLVGSDSSAWHIGVPNYARVKYEAVYPGVDLVFYGNQRQLEFDFVVAPMADASAVTIDLKGRLGGRSLKLAVSPTGELVDGAGGTVLLHKPVLYQLASAGGAPRREAVDGAFVLESSNQVKFRIGAYDHNKELVIDPTLAYSTYFGGFGTPGISGVAVDAAGNTYVTGSTNDPDFPVTPGALQPEFTGFFVSKLNPSGSTLLYSTYVGVAGGSAGNNGIAVDKEGNAYLVGSTYSPFPTTSGAYQRKFAGQVESFVAKLNNSGTAFVYSTYLNGPKDTAGRTNISAITLDSKENAYVTGDTSSKDFPVTKNVFQPLPPNDDPHLLGGVISSFIAKLNARGSALVYSSFLGGDGEYGRQIALDAADNAYVLGFTTVGVTPFPTTPGAFSNVGNVYLAKVNATASRLVFYTLLGEFGATAMTADATGNVYLAGNVADKGAPSYPGLREASCGSCENAFAIKLNAAGSTMLSSAYLGKSYIDPDNPGAGTSSGSYSIALDAAGDIFLAGYTTDPDFPLTDDAYQKVLGDSGFVVDGGGDAFLTKLDPSLTTLLYSTFLGGNAEDGASYIALDSAGDAVVAGYTESENFPLTPDPIESNTSGFGAFLSKFSFAESFCSYKVNLRIAIDPSQQEGFALKADFALGSSASLDPQTQPVTLMIGNQTIAIPAGKMVKTPAGYSFDGTINGVQLLLILHQTDGRTVACQTPAYELLAAGVGGKYETVADPVNVAVSIGANTGSLQITPVILE